MCFIILYIMNQGYTLNTNTHFRQQIKRQVTESNWINYVEDELHRVAILIKINYL